MSILDEFAEVLVNMNDLKINEIPTRPPKLFCTLSCAIKDMAVIDGCIFAGCEDGSIYLVEIDGNYEKVVEQNERRR